MDLDDMVSDALSKIDTMTNEEFKDCCIEVGYEPIEKEGLA